MSVPMIEPELHITYHSRKMLLTLDLNSLVEILISEYGESVRLTFVPMTKAEREDSEEWGGPVPLVRTRFLLRELRPDGATQRREDLEQRIVHEGRK